MCNTLINSQWIPISRLNIIEQRMFGSIGSLFNLRGPRMSALIRYYPKPKGNKNLGKTGFLD